MGSDVREAHMGNIGEEQPEIEVLPTHRPEQPQRAPAPAEPAAPPRTPAPKEPAPA
jgi:hypothetical protein